MVSSLDLKAKLHEHFGFKQFKGVQEDIIKSIIEGNHTFVIMPTGGGKSLCYQLPALILEGTAVVVSPLIALMKNQVDSVRHNCNDNNVAHFLNSSLNKSEARKVKEDVVNGKTKLLYVAPESLNKEETVQFLSKIKISFFAIDEAHCISEWGHDFRPEYRRLRPMMEQINSASIIALTATATDKVQQDIRKNLGMTNANIFKMSFNRSNLYYEVRPKQDIAKEIVKYVKSKANESGIIYCLSRKKVEELAEILNLNGIKALPYHAGLDANTRARHQDGFLMEDVDVIVATIAFGMGIDKPDVRFVIHHDIPKSLESYYQETGRAGRDGGVGECLTFYSYKDIEKLEKFLQGKPVAEQEIGKQLLMEMVAYAETSLCRRQYVLHYFGEMYDSSACNCMCDNCKNPREKTEGKDQLLQLMHLIKETKANHRARHLVNILTATVTNDILTYEQDKCASFGSGKEFDHKFWNACARQAVVAGYLRKEVEQYGVVKITEKGYQFIDKPCSFPIVKEHDYTAINLEEAVNKPVGKSVVDPMLLGLLKDLRRKIAKDKGIPPFVIFQDPSLEDMCVQYPICSEDVLQVVGVGQGKAKRYGAPFIELIKKYVEENEIERSQDLVVKSKVNKSGLKVHIITSIDRKKPLTDIAAAKGKKLDDIILEIEAIVNSGTRVNIDYYLNEELEEDAVEEIFEYFEEAETDSIQDALAEFDEDFTEEEIRLVRIKFMSELAN